MDDHANFWLLAGTAGPVLLIAHILNAARSGALGERYERSFRHVLNSLNWLGSISSLLVLVVSLAILGDLLGADSATTRWIGMVATLTSAISLIPGTIGALWVSDNTKS